MASSSSPTPNLDTPETRDIVAKSEGIIQRATNVVIATPADMEIAAIDLQGIKGVRNRVDAERKKMTNPLDDARRAIMDFFRAPLAKLDTAEALLKQKIGDWQDKQEQARREAQARLDEEARKKQERLEAQAARAKEAGKDARAAELEIRAAEVVAPIAQTAVPQVSGMKSYEVWDFVIERPDDVPREFCSPDAAKIRGYVKALKANASVKGVRIFRKTQIASASR